MFEEFMGLFKNEASEKKVKAVEAREEKETAKIIAAGKDLLSKKKLYEQDVHQLRTYQQNLQDRYDVLADRSAELESNNLYLEEFHLDVKEAISALKSLIQTKQADKIGAGADALKGQLRKIKPKIEDGYQKRAKLFMKYGGEDSIRKQTKQVEDELYKIRAVLDEHTHKVEDDFDTEFKNIENGYKKVLDELRKIGYADVKKILKKDDIKAYVPKSGAYEKIEKGAYEKNIEKPEKK